ncbi:MAG TPA: glycosyltransferase family 4 protein [Syntrophobacteraceae bacterium]|nr:glycosyltransferase family 4 protein [Syntrophobacteraceae bacterium]
MLRNAKIKVLYVTNTDWGLYNFRLAVLQALRERNFEVSAAAAKGAFWSKVRGLDRLVELRHYRKSVHPMSDIRLVKEIRTLLLEEQPDIVHFFSIKPTILGGLMARPLGVPIVVHTIAGRGSLFSMEGWGAKLLRVLMVNPLYRLVGALSDLIFFQNDDDRKGFLQQGMIPGSKAGLVPGSGVDTDYFSSKRVDPAKLDRLRKELGIGREATVVTLISRMLYDKGIGLFVAAAREIRNRNSMVRFVLVGPHDLENPSGIPLERLEEWNREGIVSYLGRRPDVRELLALSDIVTLPSHYREGVPRVLLEAAAMGKPVVTTDMPGCRDAVQDRKTGLLVPPKDPVQLTRAIQTLIEDPELRDRFGQAARKLAEDRFEIGRVIDITFRTYCDLLRKKGYPSQAIPGTD